MGGHEMTRRTEPFAWVLVTVAVVALLLGAPPWLAMLLMLAGLGADALARAVGRP